MEAIGKIYEDYPFSGYRKMHVYLRRQGFMITRKKVYRLMKLMGLQAVYPKKKTTIKKPAHKVFPYLLRDVSMSRLNQAWSIDITYIKLNGCWVYCIAIIDIFSRKIMGWAISPFADVKVCLEVLEMALKQANPEIINSDQGCQFTSKEWVQAVTSRNIEISMDGKGRWADNVWIERFWRTLKYEEIFLSSFQSLNQIRTNMNKFINFYNSERPHQTLGYQTPNAVYYSFLKGGCFLEKFSNNYLPT
jgi:putative transposase